MIDDFAINGATQVLTDATRRARLLGAIVTEVVSYDLDGVDIDFEEMGAAGRDPFSAFMRDLAHEMHVRGRKLSVAVYPKTSEPGQWGTQKSHDYVALGAVVDRFKIMLYSYDGPVAPLTYIESVCGFAKTCMPASKIYAGIPFYGWDKPETGTKRSVTETSANALRRQVGASLVRHAASQEASFTYTDSGGVRHTVFYQDAVSIGAKCDKALALGLRGVAIWRLGGEYPATWDAIRARR
jgi:spore germination protein YaaH